MKMGSHYSKLYSYYFSINILNKTTRTFVVRQPTLHLCLSGRRIYNYRFHFYCLIYKFCARNIRCTKYLNDLLPLSKISYWNYNKIFRCK